jgi:hypothetical protein
MSTFTPRFLSPFLSHHQAIAATPHTVMDEQSHTLAQRVQGLLGRLPTDAKPRSDSS